MTHFRDHADAMRVIGATFAGHCLSDQPCQSWMVRSDKRSAYHFVVTYLPGRALIVSGDIGEAIYSGITHLASLDETVRLVREADFDYLSKKSTHKKEYDARRTREYIVERAYAQMRQSFDADEPTWRRAELIERIVDWHVGNVHTGSELVAIYTSSERKEACRALLADDELSPEDAIDIADDWEIVSYSWPAAAHWHYEALRTWANLMARASNEAKRDAARAAKTEAA